jgi:hypothetical protein
MKQNKLLILSLLASFLLLFSASHTLAANTVTFGTVDICPTPQGGTVLVPVLVGNDVDLAALDIIGQIVSDGNVDLVVTAVSFDNRMGLPETLDQRYPIGDLGGGIFRLGAAKLTGADLGIGDGQIVTLTLEFLSDCALGTANLDPAEYDCNDGRGPNATMLVDTDANIIDPATRAIVAGAVNVVNTAPFITSCPGDQSILWGESVTETITADDVDLACGCDELSFSLVDGPGNSQVNSVSGVFQFVATPADIGCQHPVVIKVSDDYGGEALCEFKIDVLNLAPEFTVCPTEVISILWGQTAEADVMAVDPDGGPQTLSYTLKSFTGPGNPMVDPGTGHLTWPALEENAYIGVFTACIEVWDGAPEDPSCGIEAKDVCCFDIMVQPKFRAGIESLTGDKGPGVTQGHYYDVAIELDPSYASMEMGGYDFLIGYDASALTFISATPGQLLDDCDWEYFTYRYGWNGNCGDACPSGLLRIVALAETSNGANHPICFDSGYGTELALMTFFVTNDRTFECVFAPIYWFWMDCGDNVISSKFGDTLFLEDRVFNAEGNEITLHGGFPNTLGTDDMCLIGDKDEPLRAIDFTNGGIQIICADSIDARGDINVNGIKNEIADAVMFTNYFVNGLSAFGTHVEASIAASDVNADGIALSVADLVHLVRVIQGDALPYAKLTPLAETMVLSTQMQEGGQLEVSYSSDVQGGAALLVFNLNGEIGEPILGAGAGSMEIKYSVTGDELRVLIYNIGPNAIASGDNVLLTIPTTGSLELREIEVADFNGNALNVTTRVLPSKFALSQNYPNPFNPKTKIELDLPIASEYSVAIYNIAGQLIRNYTGSSDAGVKVIEWDGTDASGLQVASGIYFYKATASNFTASKKMVLMK